MMENKHTSLATKYRPKDWNDVSGQEAVVNILRNQVETGTFKQSYLLTGKWGSGKTTCARILAKSINGTDHDIYEIDAATHNGVDHVRAIAEDEKRKPLVGKYKVYILDECFGEDVEILTDKGFKAFKDLDRTEKVAQYHEDGSIDFVAPLRYIQRPSSGGMIKFCPKLHGRNRSTGTGSYSRRGYVRGVDDKIALMTRNHIQPLIQVSKESGKEKLEFIYKEVSSIIDPIPRYGEKQKSKYLVVSGKAEGSSFINFSPLDEIITAIGLRGKCEIPGEWKIPFLNQPDFDESELFNEFIAILSSLGIKYQVSSDFFALRDCPIKAYVKVVSFLFSDKVFDGDLLKYYTNRSNGLGDISSRLGREIIKHMFKWDFDSKIFQDKVQDKHNYYLQHDSVGVLNLISTLAAISGIECEVSFGSNVVRLCDIQCVPSTQFSTLGEYDDDGKYRSYGFAYNKDVYCVEVPTHMIVVRANGYTFISGNCHLTSASAWGAWLKLLEEPPATAINIFATTNPEKVPNTILSRVQRYDFTNIPRDQIYKRLKFISEQEGINIDEASLQYLSKAADGGMRDAISMLDKCASLGKDISMKEITERLSLADYSVNFDLMEALIAKDSKNTVRILNEVYERGLDIRKFMQSFMWFVCDVCNYFVFNSFQYIGIPELPEYVERMRMFSQEDSLMLLEWCKLLNGRIRMDNNPKNLIIVEALLWTKRN